MEDRGLLNQLEDEDEDEEAIYSSVQCKINFICFMFN